MVEISSTNILIGLAINGVFTGIGTAIGNYFANRHIVSAYERLLKKKNKFLSRLK